MIREFMDESEKEYIRRNILNVISKDIDKMVLFENISRAKLMLETTINRLDYEKERYEIKLDILREGNVAWQVVVSVRPKDCEEALSINARISSKGF